MRADRQTNKRMSKGTNRIYRQTLRHADRNTCSPAGVLPTGAK